MQILRFNDINIENISSKTCFPLNLTIFAKLLNTTFSQKKQLFQGLLFVVIILLPLIPYTRDKQMTYYDCRALPCDVSFHEFSDF